MAKVVPIIIFIVVLLAVFNFQTFLRRTSCQRGMAGPSLLPQIRGTMLVTLYAFLGIEGASVYSRYAKRGYVGRATLLGLAGVTAAAGAGHASALRRAWTSRGPGLGAAAVDGQRSGAGRRPLGRDADQHRAARLGAGAYLAWSLICAEVLFSAAHSGRHAQDLRYARTATRCRPPRSGSPTPSSR